MKALSFDIEIHALPDLNLSPRSVLLQAMSASRFGSKQNAITATDLNGCQIWLSTKAQFFHEFDSIFVATRTTEILL